MFFIVEKKYFLYTGLIGDALDNDYKKNLSLIIVLIGNFIGTFIVAYLVTSAFTFILQNGIVNIETQEVFTSAMNDVELAVKENPNNYKKEICKDRS